MPGRVLHPAIPAPRPLSAGPDRREAQRLLREASLELARLRRIRGASHRTWRRIAQARARLAFAAALLAAPVAEPAAARDPLFSTGIPLGVPALPGADPAWADPTLADLDGDGDVDVFHGEQNGRIRLFENTGTATHVALAPGQLDPFGLSDVGTRAEPSFADLDGDGDLDALVGTLGTGLTPQVQFFQNTGTATSPAFALPVTNPFGLSGMITELADLDGDGDVDAFRAAFPGGQPPFPGQESGTVFHENTGSATAPAFAPGVTSPFGLAASARAFADLDGDGDLDGIGGVGGLQRFENTGSATSPAFAAPVPDPLHVSNEQNRFDFADVDGDGDLDALLAAYTAGDYLYASTVWIENAGDADAPLLTTDGNRFGLGRGFRYYGDAASNFSLADLDGDGDLDALFGSFVASDFEANVGSPSAPEFAPVPVELPGLTGNEPVLADLDADGDPDALFGLPSGELLFFENTGTASTPELAAALTSPFGLADVGDYAAPDLADLDGDGDLDALVGNGDADLVFFANTGGAGAPAFAAPVTNPSGLQRFSSYASPDLADLDADGDFDALVGTVDGLTRLYLNTGSATTPAFSSPTLNAFGLSDVGAYAAPELADLDGDGDLDAHVGNELTSWFFQNTGTASAPAFAVRTTHVPGNSVRVGPAAAFADVDADGDLDAVAATRAGFVGYYPNVGTPTTPRFVEPLFENPFGIRAAQPEFADLDADGDFDLFSGTSWFENTGSVTQPAFGSPISLAFGLPSIQLASLASADLDADGDLDALIGGLDGNLVYVANTGSAAAPAFGAPTTNPFGLADVGIGAFPELADLDGDGDLDALVGDYYSVSLRFFENTGSPTTPAFAAAVVDPFGLDARAIGTPEVADLDGDGDLDVLGGGRYRRVVFSENRHIDPNACEDGLDNDGDGAVDLGDDPGCADATDSSELSALHCDNAIDDDGDGVDDLADPGCVSLEDASELSPPAELWGCGMGPELLLLAPLLASARRRREP